MRRIIRVGAAGVVLMVAGACARDRVASTFDTDTDTAVARNVTVTPRPSLPTTSGSPRSMPAAPVTTASTPDATTTLTAALDTLATGYHFVTTATVDGQVTMTAEGDHVAGTTRMTVTTGDTSTRYLVTPHAAWVEAEGAWQRLDSTQGLTDPVGQLRSPLSVDLVGTAEAATITARYAPGALGVRGAGEHEVEFRLTNGAITALHYSGTAAVDGDGTTVRRRTEMVAAITPIESGTEITLPPAGG